MAEEDNDNGPSVEERAKNMGWIPEEEFKGDKAKFVSAEDFVQRGEEYLPFIKAENRKLTGELAQLRGAVQEHQNLLRSAQETISALKEFHTELNVEKAKSKRVELTAALKQARDDGDVTKETEIQDQLDQTREVIKAAGKTPTTPERTYTETEVMRQWKADNAWYGTDVRKTAIANGLSAALRQENPELVGRPFLDKLAEETDKILGGNQRRTNAAKVEGDTRHTEGGGNNAPKGKGFKSLPPEAQAACDRFGMRVVGKGRAYETMDDWRKHYVKEYYEQGGAA